MNYTHFSHNGKLLPAEQAVVPLSDIAYSYGFGVYETIRVVHGVVYFASDHCARLISSAKIIGLTHNFDDGFLIDAINALVRATDVPAYNLKLLLIGDLSAEKANLYITCLNPHFPDRKLYRDGVHVITDDSERLFPQAKSLNMLTSYRAYARAKQAGAYDALLINHAGHICEGTRTNFFGLSGRTLVSPPAHDCLHGVTRAHVMEVAQKIGFQLEETTIALSEVSHYDSVFITGTVSKLLPIRSIDARTWDQPLSPALHELMQAYDQFLDDYTKRQQTAL